jgi:hypothetical protein
VRCAAMSACTDARYACHAGLGALDALAPDSSAAAPSVQSPLATPPSAGPVTFTPHQRHSGADACSVGSDARTASSPSAGSRSHRRLRAGGHGERGCGSEPPSPGARPRGAGGGGDAVAVTRYGARVLPVGLPAWVRAYRRRCSGSLEAGDTGADRAGLTLRAGPGLVGPGRGACGVGGGGASGHERTHLTGTHTPPARLGSTPWPLHTAASSGDRTCVRGGLGDPVSDVMREVADVFIPRSTVTDPGVRGVARRGVPDARPGVVPPGVSRLRL